MSGLIGSWFKLGLAVVALLMGLGYLYRPDLISRLNAVMRDAVFNDAHLALDRKKWGVFFLLMAFLLAYMALSPAVRRG